MPSILNRLPGPLRDRRRGFVESERGRPLEAPRPRDQNPGAAPERVRRNPAFIRLREALPGGLTAASMRARRAAQIPLQSKTVRGIGVSTLPSDGGRQRPLYLHSPVDVTRWFNSVRRRNGTLPLPCGVPRSS